MRTSCLNCTRKHLAQAQVLLDEYVLGYPQHKWLAVGHMAEAESEILERVPMIAHQIRHHRVELIENNIVPNLMKLIAIVSQIDVPLTDIQLKVAGVVKTVVPVFTKIGETIPPIYNAVGWYDNGYLNLINTTDPKGESYFDPGAIPNAAPQNIDGILILLSCN